MRKNHNDELKVPMVSPSTANVVDWILIVIFIFTFLGGGLHPFFGTGKVNYPQTAQIQH